MDREQAKALWPIIKAYAEGKQIEIKPKVKGSYWDILEEDDMQYIDFKKCDLRIKPEPEYRPFKDAEECFEEMKKHQPFAGRNKHKQTMKQEVFQERMDALSVKLREVENEMRELQEEYIANYPIQSGDKCINENDTPCWLSRIVFANIYSTHPHFLVNYPKMDGTRSKQEQYVYGKLTKVE